MELTCAVQNYAWGVRGSKSGVADLVASSGNSIDVIEETPYAELWMGTHPNGPSIIRSTGTPLSSYLRENPNLLGENILSKFGEQLPFLFKVLSVNKALSIQAHPNKKHAEELHASRPDVYKDPNHKPEMAIALTPFMALCGFRPAAEIIAYFNDIPELVSVVGEECVTSFTKDPSSDNLKKCFSGLMKADKDAVSAALDTFRNRIVTLDDSKKDHLLSEVFLTTLTQYPGDVGCFSLYLLNLVKLQPGEAMFLGPNVIHAYLKGDCIECMACSDNVVRAGLTPKFQDVATLLAMLEYKMSDVQSRIYQSEKMDQHCDLFRLPVPDFSVESIQVSKDLSYSLRQVPSCSIVLVTEGRAAVTPQEGYLQEVQKGMVFFLPANETLQLTAKEQLNMFRALCV